MIVYFADRYFNIIGQASTNLPGGLTIIDDRRVCDVDSGVAVFEFTLPFNESNRALAESCGAVGNYLLRSHGENQDFYTIIDAEVDTKRQEVTVYAEDAGLDLLNEIVEAYEPSASQNIAHYINKFAYDSGFVIGVNECGSTTKKLAFTDDATAAERIAKVAEQFGCEISYSFEIDGLSVTKKLINIYKERGNDVGVQLRLNKEVDRIITKKSIANLATALLATGGTPENAENPINLGGYKYDDGEFYLDGRYLKSRSAIQKWSRYLNPSEPNTTYTGHILRKFSCDALTQATLCSAAVAELKRLSDVEVNYDIELPELPDGVGLGDRVNIVDDAGELYMSARILKLEESVANRSVNATIGEYLIKGSGISQKVADLAAQFAASAAEVAAAYQAAQAAKQAAETAAQEASNAQDAAADAVVIAEGAQAVINAMEIGGRNLWQNGDFSRALPCGDVNTLDNVEIVELAAGNPTGFSHALHLFSGNGRVRCQRFDGMTEALIGKTITLQCWVRYENVTAGANYWNHFNVGKWACSYTETDGNVSSTSYSAFFPAGYSGTSDGWVRLTASHTFRNDAKAASLGAVWIGLEAAASGEAWVTGIKLEFGNQATDWTPAPEDMATGEELAVVAVAAEQAKTDAGNAAKTATNFMSFDTANGLLVGNKTSGSWNGYRTQVKADSFNVLDASGKVLSSFGANKIELGKNNADAVVSFCNDQAQIKHRAADATFSKGDYTSIDADNLGIRTTDFFVSASDIEPGSGASGEGESWWANYTSISAGGGEVRMEAGTREVDESGNSVGSTSAGSTASLTWEGLDVDAYSTVHLKAPDIAMEGDAQVYGYLSVNGKQVMTNADIVTGTWTASINGGTITTQKCTYQKVGNMCTLSFYIQGTGGTTSTSNFYLSGAPFYPADGPTWYGGGGHVQGLYDTSNYPVTGCIIQTSNKRIYFRTSQAGGTATGYVRVGNGGATFYLSGTITYPVAE